MKAKIIAYGGDSVTHEGVAHESLDKRGFSGHAGANKAYLDILVDFLDVLLNDFHERIVNGLIFVGVNGLAAYLAVGGVPETAETYGVSAGDDVGSSLGEAIT
jgi:hypothetical protein